MASFVISKISVISLNSFFSQNGDAKCEFTSKWNRAKARQVSWLTSENSTTIECYRSRDQWASFSTKAKENDRIRIEFNSRWLVGYINMAAVPLFGDTNMVVVTKKTIKVFHIYLIKITHTPLLVPLTIFSRQGWVLVWASKLWWKFLNIETVQLQVHSLWVIYHVHI